MTNEELATLAKSGDTAAKERLFKNNQRFSHYVVLKFCNQKDQRYEDFVGIANLGMVKAYNAYDPAKGYKFLTFSTLCMRNEILLSMRKDRKSIATTSLEDSIHTDFEGNDITLSDVISDGIDFTQAIEIDVEVKMVFEFMEKLNPFYKTVAIERFVNGKTQGEIAEIVGFSKPYTSRIVRRVQQMFRSHCGMGIKKIK
ncbi:MAG: sigma-70 family RNA polymerase sigma factor [Paenibacillaceae bacterium]